MTRFGWLLGAWLLILLASSNVWRVVPQPECFCREMESTADADFWACTCIEAGYESWETTDDPR